MTNGRPMCLFRRKVVAVCGLSQTAEHSLICYDKYGGAGRRAVPSLPGIVSQPPSSPTAWPGRMPLGAEDILTALLPVSGRRGMVVGVWLAARENGSLTFSVNDLVVVEDDSRH